MSCQELHDCIANESKLQLLSLCSRESQWADENRESLIETCLGKITKPSIPNDVYLAWN
jgi:hypothetical protein